MGARRMLSPLFYGRFRLLRFCSPYSSNFIFERAGEPLAEPFPSLQRGVWHMTWGGCEVGAPAVLKWFVAEPQVRASLSGSLGSMDELLGTSRTRSAWRDIFRALGGVLAAGGTS